MSEDFHYFSARAERQLGLARAAASSEVRQAHETLASLYLDRAHGGDAVDASGALPVAMPLRR